MMLQIEKWCLEDDSDLGREKLSGSEVQSSLAVPMMALCLCQQMKECNIDWSRNNNLEEWAVKEIWKHVQVCFFFLPPCRQPSNDVMLIYAPSETTRIAQRRSSFVGQ